MKKQVVFSEDEYTDMWSSLKRLEDLLHGMEDSYFKAECIRHFDEAMSIYFNGKED